MIPSPDDWSSARSELLTTRKMDPDELGDHLAQLVWEHFSDFISDGDAEELLRDLGMDAAGGVADARLAEEMLIYLMWAHTRGVQLAFVGRSDENLVRQSLDTMHQAVFEDMVQNGTPRDHIPLFEQRVSARYADYYAAAQVSDDRLGATAFRNVTGTSPAKAPDRVRACTERAILVANPLKDFLQDVRLEG